MTDGAAIERGETRCVACREVIQPEARLCPHCRSPQSPGRWRAVGSVLKWVGGITAVISLVFGMVRANELYSSWRERSEAVEELVRAVEMQMRAKDYRGSWRLLAQARELEPGSREARRLQITLAMAWLRDIRVSGDQNFTEIVDRLLPALYRGATSPRDVAVADVLAHIGWANYLKSRDGDRQVEIDANYERALALDPGNVYAHAHFGHWVLQPANPRDYAENDLDKAKRHFAAALDGGRASDYVANLALIALTQSAAAGADLEAIRLANRVRRTDFTPRARLRDALLRVYSPRATRYMSRERLDLLTSAMPPKDLLETYLWLLGGPPAKSRDSHFHKFAVALLTEAAGDSAKALSLYRSLRSDDRIGSIHRDRIDPAIERLGGAGKTE